MLVCDKCKGHRIKTRPNKRFGKSQSVPVRCKDCGSTSISYVDPKRRRRR